MTLDSSHVKRAFEETFKVLRGEATAGRHRLGCDHVKICRDQAWERAFRGHIQGAAARAIAAQEMRSSQMCKLSRIYCRGLTAASGFHDELDLK